MAERPFLILIVLDGFGCRKDAEWNAIAEADTPRFHDLWRNSSWTTLEASGLAVGLPAGQMGNSEVGHLNIGAGRIVDQDIVRISKAFERHEVQLPNVRGKNVHLAGLLSDGGVHSLQSHLHGLIDVALNSGANNVYVHAILDGRDTPPKSAEKYLDDLVAFLATKKNAHLATIIGRYFTMDRDKRWERVQRGYDLMTLGVGTETKDPLETVRRFYEQGVTDEFMEPISVLTPAGAHEGRVEDGDVLIFFNFRADRMRQIVTSFKDADFRRLHARGHASRRDHHHEPVPRGLRPAGDLPAGRDPEQPRRSAVEERPDAVAHRRDRKVRARHLLLQRRLRHAVRRRAADPRAVAESGDLRPEAGDVGVRGRRQSPAGHRVSGRSTS
jgi:bisphosphoglycerate-independent phosphoglycerate mutase